VLSSPQRSGERRRGEVLADAGGALPGGFAEGIGRAWPGEVEALTVVDTELAIELDEVGRQLEDVHEARARIVNRQAHTQGELTQRTPRCSSSRRSGTQTEERTP